MGVGGWGGGTMSPDMATDDQIEIIEPMIEASSGWLRRQDWRAFGLCIAAGLLLTSSLPPFGWWPLAIVGIAGTDRLIAGQRAATRSQFSRPS